nr:MAG TPA: hypothetical protein [Caudoviricetes sp.]
MKKRPTLQERRPGKRKIHIFPTVASSKIRIFPVPSKFW